MNYVYVLIFFCLHFFSYAKDSNQSINIAYNYTHQRLSSNNSSFLEPFQTTAPCKIGSGLDKATIKKTTDGYLKAGNCFFQYVQTSSGNIMAVVDTTGESISSLAGSIAQVASDTIPPLFVFASQAKLLTDKVKKVTKPDPIAVEKFQKEIEPFLRTDKILNIDKLRSMKDIDQVKNFIDYTNNFTDLNKLKPEEILYLNLCDWLEPQARAINAEIKAMGGWKIIDPETLQEVIIEKLDLFHSLLGEMKPGNLKECVRGGHLLIPELRAATLEIGEITTFGDGFLDVAIRVKSNKKINSYFPSGTSITEAVHMIKNGVKNPKKIFIKILDEKKIIDIKDRFNNCFRFAVEDNIAKFHPLHPSLFKK